MNDINKNDQKQKGTKEESVKKQDIIVEDLVENKNEEKEKLEQRLKSAEEQTKRYLADYQNLQRRVQEEKIQWIRTANKDLLLKLLPVLDTLMLAQKHLQDKGLDLSIGQFLKVLEQEGVQKIETLAKEFNPHLMEAVTTKKEEGKSGKVIEEIRAGYIIDDKVLRSAQVIVGE